MFAGWRGSVHFARHAHRLQAALTPFAIKYVLVSLRMLAGSTSKRTARAMFRPRHGTAAVEAAVTLPIVVILILGMLEVGRLTEVQEILNNAAREGARQAATATYTNSQVQNVVLNYLNRAGVPTGAATVTVADLTSAGTDVSNATQNDQLQVTVSMPFSNVRWTNSSFFTSGSTTLQATAIWFSAAAQDYPTSITVPPGF